jgi:hypothetical protein
MDSLMDAPRGPWLLLMHQIPAKPDYLRVKLWRRLQRLGAVPIRNAVWALPVTDEAREDFQWLLREIEADGGDAVICEVHFVAGLTGEQVGLLKAALRDADAARQERLEPETIAPRQHAAPRGRTWVTRRGVKVDRIASAWLIRRRIDPDARFDFVEPEGYEPRTGEIRFDMYEGEYTHQGDACTFEVLASTFVAEDAAVTAMGEVVHDIDFKDAKYGRPETAGIRSLLLEGVCASERSDEARLERGFPLLDALYAALQVREQSI